MLKEYRVWIKGNPPMLIDAETSWQARKLYARVWGIDVTEVMARRND